MAKFFEPLKLWLRAKSSGSLVEILVSRCLASATAGDTLDANQENQPYGVVTPIELMKHFAVANMDCEGVAATGYIAAGFNLEVGVTIISFPGIVFGPTFRKQGQRLQNNLLLIQRLPKKIPSDKKSQGVVSGGLPPIPEIPVSSKPNRIQLLMLTGAWWEGKMTIGLAAGFGFGSNGTTNTDDRRRKEAQALGLGISLKVSAEVNVEYQSMRLEAFRLSEYKTLFDKKLIKTFGRILTKVDEKRMVEQALRFVNSKFYRDLREHDIDDVWRTPLKPGERTPATVTDGYGYSIEDALIIITNAINKATTKYRRTWDDDIAQKDSRKEFLAQLENYKTVLEKKPDFTKIEAESGERRNNFLHLWGYGGGGELGFNAGVMVVVPLVDATAKAEGRVAATNFRLQTQTQRIVQTQETEIQYRQMTLTAEVTGVALKALEVAANKLADSKATLETGATKLYNMLVYRSAFVRWLNPEQQPRDNQVEARRGTGLCFGVSIPVSSLVELAQKTKEDFEKDGFAKSLAAELRVDVDPLRECLATSWFFDTKLTVDNCLESFPTDALLLESGFALTKKQKLALARDTNVAGNLLKQEPTTLQAELCGALDTIRTAQKTKQKMELQSIRVRFRIADLRSNKSTKFKLGIPGSGSGITLRKVEEAGAEGIVDLYTHWFDKRRRKYNEQPQNDAPGSETPPTNVRYADAYVDAVPPVILLHQ